MADAPKPAPKPEAKYEPPKELPQAAAVQKFQGRPKRQPVDQAEYFYNVKGTHIVFFVSSVAMLISFLMMFHKDVDRPWKDYQRQFSAMDFEKLWYDMADLDRQVQAKKNELSKLDAQIDQFLAVFANAGEKGKELDLADFKDDIAIPPGVEKPPFNNKVHVVVEGGKDKKNYEKKLAVVEKEELTYEVYRFNQKQNFAKDEMGAARYKYEEVKHHHEEALKVGSTRYEEEFKSEQKEWNRVLKEVEEKKAEYDEVKKRSDFYEDFAGLLEKKSLARLRKELGDKYRPLEALKNERAGIMKELEDKKTRFAKERPSLTNTIRNAPGSDFFAPTLKVKQHIVLGIKDQLNFAQVTKVDRCDTCHVAIGNPTYEVRVDYSITDEKDEEFRYTFKNEFLQMFVAHARGRVDAGKCEVCKGHTPTSEIKEPLTGHNTWSSADAIKFTKVFMAHPRLDLFVSDSSKHSIDKFGCTICHEGDGRDTDFTRVVHTPNTKHQADQWRIRHGTPFGEEKYNWNYRELWDLPMFPTKYVQASCRRCHTDATELDGGEKYVAGMKLVERVGCYGCHRIDTYQILPKDVDNPEVDPNRKNRRPGPPLTRISAKVSEDWATKWVLAPREFRPTTKMPHFFGQSNTRSALILNTHPYPPEVKNGVLRSPIEDTIVRSIVKYVWSLSDTQADPAPPPASKGDAERGELIVRQVGCLACHRIEETPLDVFQDHGEKKATRSRYLEEFAPTLMGVGSKMNKTWLYNWVRDPKRHFKDSSMPNLRLSEQDAVDVVEFLMILKKPEWEKVAPPEINSKIVDDLAFEILSKSISDYDAHRVVEGKHESKLYKEFATPEGKVKWLGRKMVKNYGCYSCHQLKKDEDPDLGMDWENEEGIGVELSGSQPWGSKHPDKLDFGFAEDDGTNHHGVKFKHGFTGEEIDAHVAETRHDWLENKLRNPRVFDGGKMASKPWDELLRMPNFALNSYEIELIATFVQSFTDHTVAGLVENAKKRPNTEEIARYRGDRIVRENNCRACHRLSLDQFDIEWEREDPVKKKLVKSVVRVEGRFGREEPADDTVRNLTKWKLLADGEDLKKSGKKLFTFGWTSDHSTLAMPGVVNPDSKFVYSDGHDEWYLDVQGGEVKAKRRILRHQPMDGGEILDSLRVFKKKLSESELKRMTDGKPFDDKYVDFMDVTSPAEYETRYPPMLRSQGVKTQAEWLFKFLKAPYPIRPTLQPIYPGMKALPDVNLRMPTFDFSDEETNSISKWFAVRDHQKGVDFYPDTQIPEREESFLEARKAALQKVAPIVLDLDAKGERANTGCASCHYMAGQPPPGAVLKHAPDLMRAGERLRPRWMYEWQTDPSQIYPGTTMTQYDFKPVFGGNQKDGVHAAVEYLLNFGKLNSKK